MKPVPRVPEERAEIDFNEDIGWLAVRKWGIDPEA